MQFAQVGALWASANCIHDWYFILTTFIALFTSCPVKTVKAGESWDIHQVVELL